MSDERKPLTIQQLWVELKRWPGEHFSAAELLSSDTALLNNLPNLPTKRELLNLKSFVIACLDPIREHVNRKIIVNDCFRDPELNRLTGGVDSSLHLCQLGAAADIRPQPRPDDDGNLDARLFVLIADWGLAGQATPLFDELILYPGRVHVGWRSAGRAGELLEKIEKRKAKSEKQYRAVTVEEIRRRLR